MDETRSRMRRPGRLALVLKFGALALSLAVAGSAAKAAQESWDAVYIQNVKVGYIHIQVKPVKDKDRELLNILVDIVMNVKRGGDRATMQMRYGTIETREGEILRLDTRT